MSPDFRPNFHQILLLSICVSASLSSVFLFSSVAIYLFFLPLPPLFPQLVEMQMSVRIIGIGITRIQRLGRLLCFLCFRVLFVAVQECAFTAG